MSEQELKDYWKQYASKDTVSLNNEHLTQELNVCLKKFEHDISTRNRRETIVAIALIPCFILLAWVMPSALSKAGAVLLVLFCLFVILMLKKIQARKPTDISLPVLNYLRQYKEYLEKERKLINNVAIWYITPAMIGCSLFVIGMQKYWLVGANIFIGIIIYYLNRNAVKEYFDPLISRVMANINMLEKTD
ncbi:MAG: hypothetical protein K0Q79_1532 [Flavipsychrobacter sp.]|jgi:Mn2+/Fe2+ NRAMP family transporter|nr:hypothetical protein [Flavipsychrobacter sp.]